VFVYCFNTVYYLKYSDVNMNLYCLSKLVEVSAVIDHNDLLHVTTIRDQSCLASVVVICLKD